MILAYNLLNIYLGVNTRLQTSFNGIVNLKLLSDVFQKEVIEDPNIHLENVYHMNVPGFLLE
jgi:hypothetical protein